MPLFFFTPLFKFVAVPLIVMALLGGAYAWVTTAAFNRGVKATVTKMQVLIDKGKAVVGKDLDRVGKLPESELDEELRKLCEKHKKPEETCAK